MNQTDHRVDVHGEYDEQFAGSAPARGVRYRVLRDEWLLDRDPPLRIIHEFRIEGVVAPGP